MNGRDPHQYGLDFGLWTQAILAQLIEQKFGIKPELTAAGELLAKLGLTPQKPLQRAYQRDPEAIEKWQRERYPAIVRQARQQKADVYFWDESRFRADVVHGKTWGYAARRGWLSGRGSGNRSVLPRQSAPEADSGSARTLAR